MEITHAQTAMNPQTPGVLLLLLHGYGSNEQDLPELMSYIAPGVEYASLRAPLQGQMGGYAWFEPGVPTSDFSTDAAAGAEAVLAWINANVSPERSIVLVGFSQGGAITTELLRSSPRRFLAGVVLSGFMATDSEEYCSELAECRPPVFYGYGAVDPMIPDNMSAGLENFLKEHATSTIKQYPFMGHQVSMEEIEDIKTFLAQWAGIGPAGIC